MNIVKPSNNDNHTARIIPREYISQGELFIRDKGQDGEFVSQAVTCIENNGYLDFDFEYTFREDANYDFYLNDLDGNLIFRGFFYATNETDLQNYRLI